MRRTAWLWLLALYLPLGVLACSVFGSSLDGYADGDAQPSCGAGLSVCGSSCVDTGSDPAHCGGCGKACGSGLVCANGECTDSCPTGLEDCAGACVNVQTSTLHCGGCGLGCTSGQLCVSGACVASCSGGAIDCGGACVDPQTDAQHCGGCDQACSLGQACSGGSCAASCTSGQTECSGLCVDTQSSAQHCGTCGNACAVGQICAEGGCKIFCPGGQVECSGLCFDLQSDINNCGSCGNGCATGQVCSSGGCTFNCATGQTECSGGCVNTQTDPSHCGSCGNGCAANQECVNGSCQIACKTLLNQQITDPWGTAWDGLERAVSTYDAASAICAGIGGRLPTATELYRVSAIQSATVGQTIHTNYLWSVVPFSSTAQVRVRLSDANVANLATTSTTNFRCVCPAPLPQTFTGNNCHGPPGSACFTLDTDNKRLNVDLQDRAPMAVGSALWECAFNRGRLTNSLTLFEAMQQGLPGGSNVYLSTADAVTTTQVALLRWTGVATNPSYSAAASDGANGTVRPVRCVGVNYESGTHPATVPDEFVAPLTRLKSETADSATTVAWLAAHDTCVSRGGHMPRGVELGELVQQGLPAGSNGWVWSADQGDYNGAAYRTHIVRWLGTVSMLGFTTTTDISVSDKVTNRLSRCIYYPIDTTYTGPAAADCAGGCFELALPGSAGAKLWLDAFDRAPAASLQNAISTCRAAGGHLASPRDYVEAIRGGLPNGTNAYLWTADRIRHTDPTLGVTPRVHTVRWNGVNPAFTDVPTATNSALLTASLAYRCLWTNELR